MASCLPWTSTLSSSIHASCCSLRSSSGVWKNNASFLLSNAEKQPSVTCFLSKKKLGLMDQILDYIEGGPKLRKWYGAPDPLSKDGAISEEDGDTPEEDEVRDAILVTDGDNEIGQVVILSLIVKRNRVKALVKNKRAAMEAFGTYVESIVGDVNDSSFVKKALRGVRAIICPNEGFLSSVESLKGVRHVVLLSQLSVYRGTSGLQAIMNSTATKMAEQDEAMVMASGIPYTLIRAGLLRNTPGRNEGFSFKEGSAAQGTLSKEDAAFICVEALDVVPQRGIILEVVNGEEKVADWKECFAKLIEKTEL